MMAGKICYSELRRYVKTFIDSIHIASDKTFITF